MDVGLTECFSESKMTIIGTRLFKKILEPI
jgi:hypothetical protein